MWILGYSRRAISALFFVGFAISAASQPDAVLRSVTISVFDENGLAVAGASVLVQEPGRSDVRLSTDYAGRGTFVLQGTEPYRLNVNKPGFYEAALDQQDPSTRDVRAVLNHEQMVLEQVSVTSSVPGINPEQISDKETMNLPEIINVPYPDSRDIRNLLPFYPGVVQDSSGQVHVAGSETWATLDTLDGFDIRSPVGGLLAARVSPDAVRSIDLETTRYPVEFGRATGGVIALYTGMGDNKRRFNATDFLPSFENINGIRFDKFVPRFTFSGPLVRDRAWYFDGLEVEYDDIYIRELPSGSDTNHLLRGSNLAKVQVNTTPSNIVTGGLLVNGYHSPYDGISSLVPQQSTVNRDTSVWLPYVRDQVSFHHGALLDVGLGWMHVRDAYEPHGDTPFQITPELYLGSFFQNATTHSQRLEANAALYLPPLHWAGQHDLKTRLDLKHIGYSEAVANAPISYLREDKTLLRMSTFQPVVPFSRHNVEIGAYLQDRWRPEAGLLVEPGLRFDWDEIIRDPLFSPRIAATWSPVRLQGKTKVSAGVGRYFEHTQLEYLTRSLIGSRTDTYFAPDGITPEGLPQKSTFTADYAPLREARALNWSVGLEQMLPGAVLLKANLIRKRVSDQFTYVNQNGPAALSGTYALGSSREDHDNLVELDARHTFARGYTLFGAYTHSSAHTNAGIDYFPTISMLGPQQSGPLPWDTPNRVLSWGWLPFLAPGFRKSWDFVYTLDWHTGFPYSSVNANHEVVGAAGGRRFPNYLSFSPGLEWRFRFRGSYFGLRGVIENITDSTNPAVVNNVVDSPEYGTFSEYEGRALTARIRLIGSRK